MLSRSVVSATAAALAATDALRGGALVLLDAAGQELAACAFAGSFVPAGDGSVVARDLTPAWMAPRSGSPARFEARSASGDLVLSGSADHVRLDRPWIEAGAQVTVTEFRYTEATSR